MAESDPRHLAFANALLEARADTRDAFYEALLAATESLLPTRVRRLWLFDSHNDEFTVAASTPPIAGVHDLQTRIPADYSHSGDATRDGEPKYYPNVLEDEKTVNLEFARRHDLRDLWVLPILQDEDASERVYGALALYPTEPTGPDALGHADVRVLSRWCSFYQRMWSALDRRDVTSKLRLGRGPRETEQEYWSRVAREVANAVEFRTCTLFVADAAETRLTRIGGYKFAPGREHPDARMGETGFVRYREGLSATGYAFQQDRTVYSQNLLTEPWYTGRRPDRADRRTIPFLATPIRGSDGGRLGLIRCTLKYRNKPRLRDRVGTIDILRIEALARELGPILQEHVNIEGARVIGTAISHDLRAPTNYVRDAAGRIAKGVSSRREREEPLVFTARDEGDLRRIRKGTAYQHVLVDSIELSLRPGIRYGFELASPVEMLLEACELLDPTAEARDVEFCYPGADRPHPPSVPQLWIDRRKLNVVLHNVLQNAVKFCPPSSSVLLDWGERGDGYYLDVANGGPGISSDYADRIFDAYFRASDWSIARRQGTGLGLAIARTAMREIGGDVVLASLRDPTTFSLVFPKSLERTS